MRELDRCDFCGDAPEATYEVVPPHLPSGGRRLALCASCRDRLAAVVDPLVDALDEPEPHEPDYEPPEPDHEPHGQHSEGEPDGPAEPADGEGPRTDGEEAGTDDGEAGTDDGEAETDSEGAGTDGEEVVDDASSADDRRAERPAGYGQVLRLLRNRPEAMARPDVTELADSAYDLTAADVEAVLDAAVANGDVEETPDGLRVRD